MQANWQRVWRQGIAPLLTDETLASLENALAKDDGRLLQGETCASRYIDLSNERPVCAACVLAWIGWQSEKLQTVRDVKLHFDRFCDVIDAAMHDFSACSDFLDWYDRTPRAEMRRQLLAEVRREQARRLLLAA